MRRLMAICAAAAMMIGAPAMAQSYGGRGYDRGYDRSYERSYDHRRDYRRDYRSDRRMDRRVDRWDNRRAYRGGGSWRRHVRRCMARYRSYNPRTDRYVVRRGVTRRCRL